MIDDNESSASESDASSESSEDDAGMDYEEVPDENEVDYSEESDDECGHCNKDPYPGVEMKRKIVDFWVLSPRKRRKFSSMKSNFRLLSGERQLRKWKNALETRGNTRMNSALGFYII